MSFCRRYVHLVALGLLALSAATALHGLVALGGASRARQGFAVVSVRDRAEELRRRAGTNDDDGDGAARGPRVAGAPEWRVRAGAGSDRRPVRSEPFTSRH